MFNLYLFTTWESYTSGYSIEILDFIFTASILFGILVIISKNPIVSVLFLIGLFFTIATYLLTLGISFIGLSYLLVYVGAVSILFLFILMLINIRVSELTSDTSNSIPLGIMICFIFYYVMYNIMPYSIIPETDKESLNLKNFFWLFNSNQPSFTTSHSWEINLMETSHINTLGNVMYTNYFIWLILSSIILLLAMVGSIIITIKQTKS